MPKIELKTDAQIKRAIKEAINKKKTISYAVSTSTGSGLELRVRPNKDATTATSDFRHRYTHPITGKRPYMTLGQYPAFTLADARKQHNKNLSLLANRIDPIEDREESKQQELHDRQNTLSHFIAEWQALQQTKGLSEETLYNHEVLLRPIQKNLAHMRVSDITRTIVIKFINKEHDKYPSKSKKVRSTLWSILQIAVKHGVINDNPASDLKGILKTHTPSHQPAIANDIEQFSKLLNDIEKLDDKTQLYNKNILRLLALTFVRVGDLCSMKWKDINFITKQWTFTPQKAGKRVDMMPSVVVPLSAQSITILKDMHKLTGTTEYVFHNERRKKTPYHHRQEINKALNSSLMNDGIGYKGIHSPHGFRSSAKTMLTERLGYDEVYTELQLGHTMLNKYGRAYNRMEGLKQRSKMMQDWADYLDKLKKGEFDNVKYYDFKGDDNTQKSII